MDISLTNLQNWFPLTLDWRIRTIELMVKNNRGEEHPLYIHKNPEGSFEYTVGYKGKPGHGSTIQKAFEDCKSFHLACGNEWDLN